MRSFAIEVIFVNHLFKSCLYLVTFNDALNMVRFIKSNRFCTSQIKCSLHRHLTQKCFAALSVQFNSSYPYTPCLYSHKLPFNDQSHKLLGAHCTVHCTLYTMQTFALALNVLGLVFKRFLKFWGYPN